MNINYKRVSFFFFKLLEKGQFNLILWLLCLAWEQFYNPNPVRLIQKHKFSQNNSSHLWPKQSSHVIFTVGFSVERLPGRGDFTTNCYFMLNLWPLIRKWWIYKWFLVASLGYHNLNFGISMKVFGVECFIELNDFNLSFVPAIFST